MARSLLVTIFGDAKQFGAELDRAAGKTRQMGKVAGVAGLAIAGGLAYGLEKSVKAAMEAQQSTARLDAAFKAVGLSAKTSAGGIDKAEASGRKLGFTDDAIRGSLGSLIIATGDVNKSMSDLSVAQDIARFKSIDLGAATKMLAMAMAGSQRATKQLGITVPAVTASYDQLKATMGPSIDATEKLQLATAKLQDKQATANLVIETVSQKVKGQGEAFAGTAAGGMAQFHAQLINLEEKLGAGVLPVLARLASALATGAAFLSAHTTVVKIAVGVLATFATTLLAVSVATKVVAAAQAIMTAAQWALNVALDANPIGVVILALAALGVALTVAWQKSATFREIVTNNWNDVKSIVRAASSVISGSIGGIVASFNAVVGVLRDILGAAEAAYNALVRVANAPSRAAGGLGGVLKGVGKAILPSFGIPGFASGGMVGGPLGAPQLAVVHGGEQVLTPGQQRGGGTFIFQFPNYSGDQRELISIVRREFQQIVKANGSLGFSV